MAFIPGSLRLPLLCLSLLAIALLYIALEASKRPIFYSDITQLLPSSPLSQQAGAMVTASAGRVDKEVLFLVAGADLDQALENHGRLQRILAESQLILARSAADIFDALVDIYRPYTNQLLKQQTLDYLETQPPQLIAKEAASGLLSPTGEASAYSFAHDPFGLGTRWLEGLLSKGQPQTYLPNTYRGVPYLEDEQTVWMLVAGQLAGDPYHLGTQSALASTLDELKLAIGSDNLLYSGIVFHAAQGAHLARREISTVGIASLASVVALVLLVFRSARPIAFLLTSILIGALFATAVCIFLFERIHLVTIAFGTTLLGVAVDYGFHFVVKARALGSASSALQQIRFPLTLAMASSVTAYLFQLLAPFPGLQQMAVFSSTGLIGAWATILCLGHLFGFDRGRRPMQGAEIFQKYFLPLYTRLALTRQLRILLFILCGLGVLAALIAMPVDDDLRNLNTSGKKLLTMEKRITGLMPRPSLSRFLVLAAETEQQLLQQSEALLEQLNKHGLAAQFHLVSDWLPSARSQAHSYATAKKSLFTPEAALDQLCHQLSVPCDPLRAQADRPYRQMSLSDLISNQNLDLLIPFTRQIDSRWYSVVTINGPVPTDLLEALQQAMPAVTYIDREAEITALLGYHRKAIATYALAAFAVIFCCLLLMYRQAAIVIVTPVMASLLLALLTAAWLEGVTLFHVFACLLVFGICLDAGIFYHKQGLQKHTWLAVTLSNLTSMFVFAFLVFSEVPVLRQFGLVVFVGVGSAWLLTPLVFVKRV